MSRGEEQLAAVRRVREHLDELMATYRDLAGDEALTEQAIREGRFPVERLTRCVVCGHRGPGLTWTPDGRAVHRWPCWGRML